MAAKKVVISKNEPKTKVVVKKASPEKGKDNNLVKSAETQDVRPVEVPKIDLNAPEGKPRGSVDRGALLLGTTLLAVGAVWILGQFLKIPLGGYLWPLVIILPGVFVFISALNMESTSGDSFAVLGSILTSVGVLLFVQNLTNTWASWAYAWALIAPTSIGIGQIIYGNHKKHESLAKTGLQMVKAGLWIFGIGFIFFELIIGLNGFGLSRFGLPVFPMVLIGIGVLILIRAVLFRGRE